MGLAPRVRDALRALEFHVEGEHLPVVFRYGIQLLALVENLEEVGWTYTDLHGQKRSGVLTLEEANALLPELTDDYNRTHAGCDWEALPSVKDYCNGSPADLQRLVEVTRISS